MRSVLAGIAAVMMLCLFGMTAAALDLIRDGKALSVIVVPDQATDAEQQAAERLVKYLKMASGAELPVVKESAKPAKARIISMGKTNMAGRAGITEEGLKYDSYRLCIPKIPSALMVL